MTSQNWYVKSGRVNLGMWHELVLSVFDESICIQEDRCRLFGLSVNGGMKLATVVAGPSLLYIYTAASARS